MHEGGNYPFPGGSKPDPFAPTCGGSEGRNKSNTGSDRQGWRLSSEGSFPFEGKGHQGSLRRSRGRTKGRDSQESSQRGRGSHRDEHPQRGRTVQVGRGEHSGEGAARDEAPRVAGQAGKGPHSAPRG